MTIAYEFCIAGRLSHALLRSFAPISSRCEPDQTVFVRGVADDSELFGVIARCETLRLTLLGLRRIPSVSTGQESSHRQS